MGVGGFFKGLGKGLLKYGAPVAAGIFGGPLAAMAVSGATSGLSKKIEGGSWKDALLAGGIGAGTSYAGGKIPGLDKVAGKGLAPSKGILGRLGDAGKEIGKSALLDRGRGFMPEGNAVPRGPQAEGQNKKKRQREPIGPTRALPRMNQTTPNLAFPLEYGRQEALGQKPNLPPYMSYLDY